MSAANLKREWEKAEKAAHALQAEKDEAVQRVRDRFFDRLRSATDAAAAAQKAWLDAEAAEALAARTDLTDAERERLANTLGLSLPSSG